jgi:cytochrome c biogenesis protein CcdA
MWQIIDSIKTALENAGHGPGALALAVVLGLLSAVASACCTLPLVGVLAGLTLAQKETKGRVLPTGLRFMTGLVLALLAIGGTVVFAGQSFQVLAGVYWKIVAGAIAILLGIGALELFPFSLPKMDVLQKIHGMALGSGAAGLVFGGAIALSSLPCNPGFFIVLGAAVLQKQVWWATGSLFAYAVGFSVPLTLLVCGLSLGKGLVRLQKVEKAVRMLAGAGLIIVGIYLLYTN